MLGNAFAVDNEQVLQLEPETSIITHEFGFLRLIVIDYDHNAVSAIIKSEIEVASGMRVTSQVRVQSRNFASVLSLSVQ